MKKIIILFAAIVLFASCGILKKSNRDALRDKTETKSQVAEVIEKKDRTIVVTTEQVDTTVLIPSRRISQRQTATEEWDGSYSARFDTAGIQAMIKYNQETSKFNFDLYLPAELKPITIDRTITENRDVTEATNKNTSTTEKKDIKKKVKITEPSDPVITIFRVLGVFFVLLFLILAYRLIKRT